MMFYLLFVVLFIIVAAIYFVSGKILPIAKAYYEVEDQSAKIYSHLNQRHAYLLRCYQDEDTFELILKIKSERDLLKRLDLEYDLAPLDEECLKYQKILLDDVKNYEKAYQRYLKLEEENKKLAAFLKLPPLIDYKTFLETHWSLRFSFHRFDLGVLTFVIEVFALTKSDL